MPGAEHLLLSAIELPDGTARRAFQRIEVDPDCLSAAIAAAHAEALAGVGLRDALDPTRIGSGLEAVPSESVR